MNIKIFTVLILALTTMPGLANPSPCYEGQIIDGKCKCDHTELHPTLELYKSGTEHYVEYNKKYDQCDEWMYLDAPCIHQGHSDKPEEYHIKDIKQRGNCLVLGQENKRIRVRELISEYNTKYNKGKGSLQPGDKILIVAKSTKIQNPVELVDEFTSINNYKNRQGQPSVRGILWGYNELCKKNGAGFEITRSNEPNGVYYICQGTKNTKQTAQQSTPALTNTNAQIGNNGNKGSGNSKSNGYTVNVKGVLYDVKATATNTRQKINNIVNAYNNTTSLSPEKEINFSDMYKIFFSDGDRQEPSIIAVNDGYKSMCAALQNTNGIATTHWTNPSTGGTPIQQGKCVIDSCDQTHEKVAGRCQPKSIQTTTVVQKTPDTEITQTIKKIQSVPATIGQTITYLKSHATNSTVKQEIINWKKKCRQAVAAAQALSSDESDYIDADYDSETNSLKCRIKKCRDSNAHIAPDGKSCIANEDKSQQSRSATPDKVSAPAAQTVAETPEPTVSVEENLLESDKSSANERPEHENIEKLKPDDVALNPVAVNANDIEIKAPAIQPLQEKKCDDQSYDVQHMITVIDKKLKDESNNDYIEHSISYTSCNTLTKTWIKKCEEINKKAVIERNLDATLKLTCVPKADSEVKENNEADFDAIVQAFEKRAEQLLKDKNCGQQQ